MLANLVKKPGAARHGFSCKVCGCTQFTQRKILWDTLVEGWELTPEEESIIERQQGYYCDRCNSNLRSNALAFAIQMVTGHGGVFYSFPKRRPWLKVLEVNEAGSLHQVLKTHHRLTFAQYPAVDFQALPYADDSYDLLIHSDTLEHIPDPLTALRESLRVLKPGAWTCYTVPALPTRLTASTSGKVPTYHGTQVEDAKRNESLRVHTEFGADFWTSPIEAGFREIRLFPVEYPAAVAIAARK